MRLAGFDWAVRFDMMILCPRDSSRPVRTPPAFDRGVAVAQSEKPHTFETSAQAPGNQGRLRCDAGIAGRPVGSRRISIAVSVRILQLQKRIDPTPVI
mgnify:CR=1 FL=1